MTASRAATRAFAGFEWMLAGRYLRTRRREGFVSVIAAFSFLGIMLGVAALIIVLSVMNGFRKELLGKIVGINGHIFIARARRAADRLRAGRGAASRRSRACAAPFPSSRARRSPPRPITAAACSCAACAPEDIRRIEAVAGNVRQGSLGGFDAAAASRSARRLAEHLSLQAGDTITLVTPNGAATPFGTAPRIKGYPVAAIFEIGMSEFDASFVFMPLSEAQAFFNREGDVTVIEVFLDDADRVDEARQAIEAAVGAAGGPDRLAPAQPHLLRRPRGRAQRHVHHPQRLIVIVAALNIISGLIMLVKDKSSDIAILRTMGATRGAIMRVFLITGVSIGVAGTLAGFLLGLVFTANIQTIQEFVSWALNRQLWDPTLRFLSQVPSDINPTEVAAVVAMSLVLSLLATLYPSWRAARLDPIAALRYG